MHLSLTTGMAGGLMGHVMQAVGSMVMGLRPEKMMETDLTPRNLQTGATWKFPPVLLMAAGNDQPEILELINNTQAALQTKVICSAASPRINRPCIGYMKRQLSHNTCRPESSLVV